MCPCDGLALAAIDLNLGGQTLQGSGVCAGITVFAGTVISGGRVAGFGTGIQGLSSDTVANRVHHMQVVDNTERGVYLVGDFNTVENSIVSRNGGEGIALPGSDNAPPNGNVVRNCRVEDNDGTGIRVSFNQIVVENNFARNNVGNGIEVSGSRGQQVSLNRSERNWGSGIVVESAFIEGEGTPASVTRNWALRNWSSGFVIDGGGVIVDRNRSTLNGDGFELSGHAHLVTSNITLDNAVVGFQVDAGHSHFEDNRSSYDDFGIIDTAGTNTYIGNRCTANPLGKSIPPDLC